MTDRGILFSAPMVLALLAGTKTQTRRALNPQPAEDIGLTPAENPVRFAVGDRLWVREAWRTNKGVDHAKPSVLNRKADGLRYEADHGTIDPGWEDEIWGRLRPGMFMPRWASRLTLHVTDVRVQRLHEIGDDDARDEGIVLIRRPPSVGLLDGWGLAGTPPALAHTTPLNGYRSLWEDINNARGKPAEENPASWNANPWVAAITFAVENRNIGDSTWTP